MTDEPRRDHRGILRADRLRFRTRFRRIPAHRELRDVVEHYWLDDWDLAEPIEQQVVPHPAVNLVWHTGDRGRVFGARTTLFTVTLAARGRVFGVQFRPAGFRVFHPGALSAITARRPAAETILPGADRLAATLMSPATDSQRVTAVDEFLLRHRQPLGERTGLARDLTERVRADRRLRRVEELAALAHRSPRVLQRLFAEEVGVSPKWVINRYRIHEAVERAGAEPSWVVLAAELGYADQAHLARDFRRATAMSPTEYVRALRGDRAVGPADR